MKIKAIIFLAILIILVNSVGSEQEKLFFNGNEWAKFDLSAKLFFLRGIYDGSMAASLSVMETLMDKYRWQREKVLELMHLAEDNPLHPGVAKANFGQIAEGVDELYKDYANKHIPIFAIATLVTNRINGKIKTEDVEKELIKLRAAKWE